MFSAAMQPGCLPTRGQQRLPADRLQWLEGSEVSMVRAAVRWRRRWCHGGRPVTWMVPMGRQIGGSECSATCLRGGATPGSPPTAWCAGYHFCQYTVSI